MSKLKGFLSAIMRSARLMLGVSVVPEVCEASRGRHDYHDYHVEKGGGGHPAHFSAYRCWNCGKAFTI